MLLDRARDLGDPRTAQVETGSLECVGGTDERLGVSGVEGGSDCRGVARGVRQVRIDELIDELCIGADQLQEPGQSNLIDRREGPLLADGPRR